MRGSGVYTRDRAGSAGTSRGVTSPFPPRHSRTAMGYIDTADPHAVFRLSTYISTTRLVNFGIAAPRPAAQTPVTSGAGLDTRGDSPSTAGTSPRALA